MCGQRLTWIFEQLLFKHMYDELVTREHARNTNRECSELDHHIFWSRPLLSCTRVGCRLTRNFALMLHHLYDLYLEWVLGSHALRFRARTEMTQPSAACTCHREAHPPT